MKFESIYSFQAFGVIEDGETVYVMDRKTKKVTNASNMKVGEFAEVLKTARADEKRFEFWIEKEETENA